MVYVKLFVDYLDAIEPLGDAERGRLFTALLEYARTGEVPQLGGNERFIFPMMKAQLDRDAASNMELSEKRAAAGSLGGKQKQANLANCSKSYQDKDKEEDKDKDKEEDKRVKRPRAFTQPTREEGAEYYKAQGCTFSLDAWFAYYEQNGWMVGNRKMKDWKASMRYWQTKEPTGKKPMNQTAKGFDSAEDAKAKVERMRKVAAAMQKEAGT